jgi:hypothetical protein
LGIWLAARELVYLGYLLRFRRSEMERGDAGESEATAGVGGADGVYAALALDVVLWRLV